jgi:D-ala D-ala ligase C-terminus
VAGDRLVVNELNTMPGFTAHSMFPKVWAADGMDYPQLLDELVELGRDRARRRQRRVRAQAAMTVRTSTGTAGSPR